MQRISEDTHICHAILRGKSNLYLFEEEIQKMKILDAAEKSKKDSKIQIFAYCILDNEMHLVMEAKDNGEAKKFLEKIKREYEENTPESCTDKKTGLFRKCTVRELKNFKTAVHCSRRLHMLPVEYKIVERPEDYWWCSYPDYMGRKWISLADTGRLLGVYDQDMRKAMGRMRREYQDYLKFRWEMQ